MNSLIRLATLSIAAIISMAACGGGKKDDPPAPGTPTPTYTVGGTVSGLAGSGLVLRNNGGNDLSVTANGAFTFSTAIASGAAYAVTVQSQPSSPTQTCAVGSGSGTMGSANVTTVSITCTTSTFTLGGTVSGLNGIGLVLQNNGGNALSIASNGAFVFGGTTIAGSSYAVTVRTQPGAPIQQCTIANGSGSNLAANINNIVVACANTVPRFIYTLNQQQGTFSTFRVDPSNGELRAVSYAKLGTTPIGFRVVPSPVNSNKGFFYALNQGSVSISGGVVDRFIDPVNRIAAGPIAGLPLALPSVPNGFASHPTNRFLYVLHSAAGNVSAYTINEDTGVLNTVPGSPFAAGMTPNAMAFDATGQYAFVTNGGSSDIYVYSVNTTSGALTEIPARRTATGAAPLGMIMSSNAAYLYVSSGNSANISGYGVNSTTGALTPMAGSPFAAGTTPLLMFHPNGRFLYSTNAGANTLSTYAIDAATGVLTQVGSPLATGTQPVLGVFDATSKFLYVSNRASSTISAFSVDATTGVPTAIGAPLLAPPSPRITAEPSGRYLYAVGGNSSTLIAYSINQTTGALTIMPSSQIATGGGPATAVTALASTTSVIPRAKYAYIANDGGAGNGTVQPHTIDATTGAITPFGSSLPTGVDPSDAGATPDGKYVYVLNSGSNSISRFSSNAGVLTALGATGTAAAPHSLVVDNAGRFAVVAHDNALSVFAIDATSGGLTSAGSPTTVTTSALAIDHNGRCVFGLNDGGDTISAFTLNSETGALAAATGSPFATGDSPTGIAVHPSGRFVMVTNDGDSSVSVYSITTTQANTCALTPVSGSPFSTGAATLGAIDVAIDPTGRFAYIGNEVTDTVSVMTVDRSTGALSLTGSIGIGDGVALMAEASGRFLYVTSVPAGSTIPSVRTYNINATTGALSPAAGSPLAVPNASGGVIVTELEQ